MNKDALEWLEEWLKTWGHIDNLMNSDLGMMIKSAKNEIEQLRAVAGIAKGDDSQSFAAIRRDMEHG